VTATEKKQFMIKKWSYYLLIFSIVAFITTGFKPSSLSKKSYSDFSTSLGLPYQLPSQNTNDYNLKAPYLGKTFMGFREAVGFKESQGKYTLVNSLGYMGKYQFGISALKTVGVHDSVDFLNNKKLQEKAFVALIQRNKWNLRKIIKAYDGKIIDGICITESGILAAAHLGGAGSVKKYLYSNGAKKCKDKFGTSISHYLRKFGGYETHHIKADKNARVRL
jgi:hypothetical protein